MLVWKYPKAPTDSNSDWYRMPAIVAGAVLGFSDTDGGPGDSALAATGRIEDPVSSPVSESASVQREPMIGPRASRC